MRITLRRVAQEVGVSEATVSRILTGRSERYNAETVKRVEETAKRLRYVPNTVARSLARRRTGFIALTFDYHPHFQNNYYFMQLFAYLYEILRERDYQVTILSSSREDRSDVTVHLASGQYDGALLVAPRGNSPLLHWIQDTRYPAVSVGTTLTPEYGITSIDVDNVHSSTEAVQYLLKKGHQSIGFVGGTPAHRAAQQRYQGYLATLERAGQMPLPWLWEEGERLGEEAGRRAAERFFVAYPEATAVFCANDTVALATMQTLVGQGKQVPNDVSIIGFDDAPIATLMSPALTTVRQDGEEIGQTAVNHLLEYIENPQMKPRTILLPGSLVVRHSTASPPVPKHL
jgi:LacI family transcriptional regulator